MAALQWDRAFALEQAGDDEEMLAELLDLLCSSAADDIAKIKTAMDGGDPVAMGNGAHSIKGAAASLGIVQIAKLAESMEKAGRAGDLDGAVQFYAPLVEMVAALVDCK
ncbi:MAG: Hpt domain-containing protein [Desulfobulbaceae bacterium]|nr:Hpt domain-containing protein [Desulfobulbaceae bacterium]